MGITLSGQKVCRTLVKKKTDKMLTIFCKFSHKKVKECVYDNTS